MKRVVRKHNVHTKMVSLTITTTKFRAACVMRKVRFSLVVCGTKGNDLILGVGTELAFYSLIC